MDCEHLFKYVPKLDRQPETKCEKCGISLAQAQDDKIDYLNKALAAANSATELHKGQINDLLSALEIQDKTIPYDWLEAARKMRRGIKQSIAAYEESSVIASDKNKSIQEKYAAFVIFMASFPDLKGI